MERKLVLVGGGSGAGKTSLAETVSSAFGNEITMLSTDRFYRDFDKPQEAVNWDHPDSVDWTLMNRKLEKLMDEGQAQVPIFDFREVERTGYEELNAGKAIILEGIFALVNRDVNSKASMRIYVETDADIRLIRRIRRDTTERGRETGYVIDQWERNVKPMHEEYIIPSRKNAHLIVPEDPDGNMREEARKTIISRLQELV